MFLFLMILLAYFTGLLSMEDILALYQPIWVFLLTLISMGFLGWEASKRSE